MTQKFLLWLARKCAARYGYIVVHETPASLLPSRITAISETVAKSGHLAHRYHVRQVLERRISEAQELVEAL